MSAKTFPRALAAVLAHEGGWSDHPSDPGGATMKGITIGVYSAWVGHPATKAELRAISDETVAAIYRKNYWDKVHGDDLPAGVDYATFDAAVNSGPARGAKWLQLAVRTTPDGQVGPETISAARKCDPATVIRSMQGTRLRFLKDLKTWPVFGKGWERRVHEVEKLALMLAGAPPGSAIPPPPDIEPTPPRPLPKPATGAAAATGGASAIVAAGAAAATGHWPVALLVVLAGLAVAAFIIWKRSRK